MKKDIKDRETSPEPKTFLEKLEQATQNQASLAVIAQIMQQINDEQNK